MNSATMTALDASGNSKPVERLKARLAWTAHKWEPVYTPRRQDGKYARRKWDAVCTCGHTLGEHDAAYPHAGDECSGGTCEAFRPAKKKAK